jgi:hypothetical protein
MCGRVQKSVVFAGRFRCSYSLTLAHPQIPSSSLALDDGDNELAVPGAGILPA